MIRFPRLSFGQRPLRTAQPRPSVEDQPRRARAFARCAAGVRSRMKRRSEFNGLSCSTFCNPAVQILSPPQARLLQQASSHGQRPTASARSSAPAMWPSGQAPGQDRSPRPLPGRDLFADPAQRGHVGRDVSRHPCHSRVARSRNPGDTGGHRRTRRRLSSSTGRTPRKPQDTRGHGITGVRDREARFKSRAPDQNQVQNRRFLPATLPSGCLKCPIKRGMT